MVEDVAELDACGGATAAHIATGSAEPMDPARLEATFQAAADNAALLGSAAGQHLSQDDRLLLCGLYKQVRRPLTLRATDTFLHS